MSQRPAPPDPEVVQLTERQEMQTLLGSPPGWLLRWGITFFAAILLVLLAVGWLVKYPDLVIVPVSLGTEQPALRLAARQSGPLQHLLVDDGAQVEEGELLAVLENAADYRDVLALSAWLEGHGQPGRAELSGLAAPTDWKLGRLQTIYAECQESLRAYQAFLQEQAPWKKVQAYQRQKAQLDSLNLALARQQRTLEQEVALALRQWERQQGSLRNGAASELEVDVAETAYLRTRRQLEELQSAIYQNEIRSEDLSVRIVQEEQSFSDEERRRRLDLLSQFEQLQSEVEQWGQTYLLRAPIEGQVSFPRPLAVGQFLSAEQEMLAVVPAAGRGGIVARGLLSGPGSGKVQIGAAARLRLEGFPYQEFGTVEGRVSSISLLSDQGAYLIELALPDTLLTSYRKQISFRQEMAATAHIVTEERRFLLRLFDRLRSVLSR